MEPDIYLPADLRTIFMRLRSLKAPGEEDGTEEGTTFTPLQLLSDVQWKADLRRCVVVGVVPPAAAAELLEPAAFQQ